MKKRSFPLFFILFLLFPALSAQADNNTCFFEETVQIGWLHVARTSCLFSAESRPAATLKITNTIPDNFCRGFVTLNNRWYWFGDEDSFSWDVRLRKRNHLRLLVFGEPGTSLHLEIAPPRPQVTAFSCAPDTIIKGETATLSWGTEHAATVTIEPSVGAVEKSGSIAVSPDMTTEFVLTAANAGGAVSEEVSVRVLHPPVITIIEPDGNDDLADESFTISWEDEDPDSNASIALYYDTDETGADGTLIAAGISEDPDGADDQYLWDTSNLDPGQYFIYAVIDDGQTPPETAYGPGPVVIERHTPYFTPVCEQEIVEDQTLTLVLEAGDPDNDPLTFSASNLPDGAVFDPATHTFIWTPSVGQTGEFYPEFTVTDGEYSDTMTVKITVRNHPPTVTMAADPQAVVYGEASTLTWSSGYADTCEIEPDIGEVPLNGSVDVSPESDTTFVITASTPVAEATDSVDITVMKPPRVSLSVSEEVINCGETVTLTWDASPAQTAYLNNGIGEVAAGGSMELTPEYTTTYAITAVNGPLTSHHSISVKVLGNPPADLPEGSFGEQYNDLVPADASLPAYDAKRFVVLTGRIQDINENPLPEVSVSVIDHPEYGSVLTDETGRYAIPAEGGGLVRVNLEKPGYLTAQRKLEAPVKDFAVIDPVTLLTRDPAATEVVFDGDPDTIMTHQSTEISDEYGSRSCTMVFTGDNTAYELDRYGNVVRQLSSISARATEYTTPGSMPAKLPPTSAFTFCAELEADGIDRIAFEKPVTNYVDNFPGFEVGEIVPVGYYDRDRALWVPSENGVVVRLLDTDSNGIVDALDADGDDLPDDLDGDGNLADEAAGLDTAAYQPGETCWRFQVKHFSPWDCNWPYGPPDDAEPPNPKLPPKIDEGKNDCNTPSGSYINDRSRVMHEDIPVYGTDMTLHYAADRVPGYKTYIDVPASGETVPASLKQIIVKCEIAGKTMQKTLDPLPEKKARFIWDGQDCRGNEVNSPVDAGIKIGFVYDAVYYSPSGNFDDAFAQADGTPTAIEARQEIVFWEEHAIKVTPPQTKASGNIASGWTISSHHQLNPAEPSVLHKGIGTNIRNNTTNIITTVAGTDTYGYNGDNIPATEAEINHPKGIALDHQGNLFIADESNHRIRKVDTNGIITTVAGYSEAGYSGDGRPATRSRLYYPKDVAVDHQGNLFFTDGYHCVRKVDTNGIFTTVAGISGFGYNGDNIPAKQAALNHPKGIAVGHQGNLFIADESNHRIRKIDANGIITTVAGNGSAGYSGDNGPATQAQLDSPRDLAVDQQGNLFIADNGNKRIRKVEVSGIITTVAGGGSSFEDNIPATQARISVRDVALGSQGNLFIAAFDCVHKVDANGIITTVAGNGSRGCSGDGGPATQAQVNASNIALDHQGNLFVVNSSYPGFRVRKVAPPAIFSTMAGSGDIIAADPIGQGYILGSTGQHQKSMDIDTGRPLHTFAYEMFGEREFLTAITDPFGNQTKINRYSDGTPYSIISSDGLTTLLSVDESDHMTRITLPDGGVYDFSYTSGGLLTDKTEPISSHTYQYVYDENGRITDTYDEKDGHWQFDRYMDKDGLLHHTVLSAENNLTAYEDKTLFTGEYISVITDPAGEETDYTRSADGLFVQKEPACGMDLDFTYDVDPEYKYRYVKKMAETTPSGLSRITDRTIAYEDTDADDIPDRITRTVCRNDKPATLENDVLAAVRTVTTPEGRTTTTAYDPETLVTTETRTPGLFPTTCTYYPNGKLETVTTGSRQTAFTYDNNGFLDSVTGPRGLTTGLTNDKAGRVTRIDRPDGTALDFVYDANGNLTVLTNPSNVDHQFDYNAVDQTSAYTAPLSGSYRYMYDQDRRLIKKRFPSGQSIVLDYTNPGDAADKSRLWQIQTPEGNIDYTYLCGGRVASVTQGPESITFGYDGRLITSETFSGTLNQTLDYTYNNDFDLASATYAGATENYTYDSDGLITGAGDFTISRHNEPGVNETGLPYNVSNSTLNISRSFNNYGEIAGQDADVEGRDVYSWTVTDRCPDGKIKTRTETIEGVTTTYDYTYDEMGRLKSVTQDGVLVEEYAYANRPYGTRTFQMNAPRGIAGRSLAYDEEDRLLSAGSTDYRYDADGFLQSKTTGAGTTAYEYSSRGGLLTVELPDGTVIEYVHDPLGRRIAKKVNGTITRKYLWQGLTRLLAVYDGSDNLLMRFRYAGGRLPYAIEKEGVTYYPAYDPVGSLRALADSTGNVVKEITYDSFGFILSDTDPSFEIPLGFAGGLHDRDTGLVRFGYRDYDPDTGRWTAKDPILFAAGDTDLYGYCLSDPVNWIDPYGEFFQSFAAGITAGTITGGISFVTELAKGASIADAAKSAAISGVTSAVSVGLASTGIGALYAGGIAATTNALMQKMLSPCEDVNLESALFSALPPSFGGVMVGKTGLKGITQGAVTGIISGPSNVAGNAFFNQ